jgi:hypothetical protein
MPKFGARWWKTRICRRDTNFGTPQPLFGDERVQPLDRRTLSRAWTDVHDLSGRPLRESLEPEQRCRRYVLLSRRLPHRFLQEILVDLVGLPDHHRPIPVELALDRELRHVRHPPQPLERHHPIIELLRSPLERELERVRHREERLDRLRILRRDVRVAVAVDHQKRELGHIDKLRYALSRVELLELPSQVDLRRGHHSTSDDRVRRGASRSLTARHPCQAHRSCVLSPPLRPRVSSAPRGAAEQDHVATSDNAKWSLCGVPWLQPVATGRKSPRRGSRENKPSPMVRRGSTVRVRQRAWCFLWVPL